MLFNSNNYGCELTLMCDVHLDNIPETYAGFFLIRNDDGEEIARFYEGDPYEDFDTAISYAQSVTNKITRSAVIAKLWKKLGKAPKEVKR